MMVATKIWILVTRLLKIFFSKTNKCNSTLRYCTISPWVCVIKICSSGAPLALSDKILAELISGH